MRALLLMLVTAVVLAVVFRCWQANPGSSAGLRSPPDIPPLTAAEFASLSEARVLARVSTEASRRIIAAGSGWGSAAAVLPPPLCHVWTVAVLEPSIARMGFAVAVTQESAPSPMVPPLRDLVAAYRALGLDALAGVVAEADGLAADATAGPGGYGRLDARFRSELAKAGSTARCVAYAQAHRDEILADPAH